MWLKIHRSYRTVVALCDSDLLGKKLEEGNRELEVRETFFKGDNVDKERATKILQLQAREDATFNIVGKESINTAIEAGIIKESSVLKINDVPFALVLL